VDSELTLVVGLGNPGPEYAGNRHNAGSLVADELAARAGGRFRSHKAGVNLAEGRLAGRRVAVAKPQSYMNLSGGPVAGTLKFFTLSPAELIVVHDELDIEFGAVRLKFGGGAGGHNGLRSITKSVDTADYYRVRVGIGRPPGRMDPADFLLRDFSAAERKELPFVVDRAADAVTALLTGSLESAQNSFHAG